MEEFCSLLTELWGVVLEDTGLLEENAVLDGAELLEETGLTELWGVVLEDTGLLEEIAVLDGAELLEETGLLDEAVIFDELDKSGVLDTELVSLDEALCSSMGVLYELEEALDCSELLSENELSAELSVLFLTSEQPAAVKQAAARIRDKIFLFIIKSFRMFV